jgi:ABC-type dipeptide/oligopeptide/nickel transport system ATPase component
VLEPLLEVRDLKKHFAVGGSLWGRKQGWVKAVDGINFTIHTSETLGLVGESGCHFHPRCPFAMPRCSGQEPRLVEGSAGHQVACYLY